MRVIMYIINLFLCCVCFVIIWYVCVTTVFSFLNVYNKHYYYYYNGFGHVWINQGVDNQKQFLNAFEIRCRDIYSQQCLSEIRDSSRCRMYEEIKPSFSASYYVKFNIHKNL